MGFFDFFKDLFGGSKPKYAPEELNINITDTSVSINGNIIEVPCHLDRLKAFFGKPRKFVGKSGNINFTWDDLGVYCYTKGNNVVYCIAVKAHKGDIVTDTDPRSMFKGVLTINGEPWEEVMHGGEDLDVARERVLNGLALFSEYVDMEKGDSEGCRGAYSGVEVSLPLSAGEMEKLVDEK